MRERRRRNLYLPAVLALAFLLCGGSERNGLVYAQEVQEETVKEQSVYDNDTNRSEKDARKLDGELSKEEDIREPEKELPKGEDGQKPEEELPKEEDRREPEEEHPEGENGQKPEEEHPKGEDAQEPEEEHQEPEISVRCLQEAAEIQGHSYFREAPEIVLSVTAPAGIDRITYGIGEDACEVQTDLPGEDESGYKHEESYERIIKVQELFRAQGTEPEDGSYVLRFQVTDMSGACAEAETEFILDQTPPDPEVFVSYHSDSTNPYLPGETGIRKLFSAIRDRLFGKQEVWFNLYLRDEGGAAPSGIDLEDLREQIRLADGNAAAGEFQAEESLVSFLYEGVLHEGYTHVRGRVTVPKASGSGEWDRLLIGRLRDRAGNVTGEQEAEALTGTTILYFDQTAPVLSADYGEGILDPECGHVFYREEARIRLLVAEEHLGEFTGEDGQQILPRVDSGLSEGEGAAAEVWTASDSGIRTEIRYPVSSPEREAVYQFTVAYQDASGNLLETDGICPGKAEQGIYTSIPVVVDNRAPKLCSFAVEGKSGGRIDGRPVYRNREGDDVTISFTIDDHETYWDPSRVRLMIRDRESQELVTEVDGDRLKWDTEGRSHRAVYGFDGEEAMEAACYEVLLSYEDRAGNPMIGSKETEDRVTGGSYQSEAFFLDHQAPGFSISYPAAFRLVRETDADPSADRSGAVPQTGYTAYYNEEIPVCISIREASAWPVYQGKQITGLKDLTLTVTGEDGSTYQPEVRWERQKELYKGNFTLSEEGQYEITVSYEDLAGNRMVFEQAAGDRMGEAGADRGIYESVPLVLDQTAPGIRLSYIDQRGEEQVPDAFHEGEGRAYFRKPVWMRLEAEDQNLRFHEILEILDRAGITDLAGNPVPDNSVSRFADQADRAERSSGTVVCYIPLTTEAAYGFVTGCEDLAGNRAAETEAKVSIDRTCPELKLSYSVEPSGFLDTVRYQDIRYLFADSRMTVKVSAGDRISGLRTIRCTIREEDGSVWEETGDLEPAAEGERVYTIPLQGTDLKGTMTAEVWDWCGNPAFESGVCTVESEEKHAKTCRAWIETDTEPGRRVGGEDYYRGDIHFRLMVEDTCSGLRTVSCRGGKTIDRRRDYTKEGIVFRHSEELILEASGNNENGVLVRAEYQDRTGHGGELEQRYHIDITPPVVEVIYDQEKSGEGRFYRQSRTAVIRIRERNLDPSDVEFHITASEGALPLMGEWEHSGEGDEMLHTCSVLFAEDGDYTFSLSVTDLAGNRTEYGQTDEFTIDQTAPVLAVVYDSDRSTNQIYYAEGRTATIDVLERHFDEERIHVDLETVQGGEAPVFSGWSHQGDHHRASVAFLSDGTYRFGITGMDLAGNEMEAYGMDEFVIDQTPPALFLYGVEDRSANQGAVRPRIRCEDANYGGGQMEILLEGCQHGVLDPQGIRSRDAGAEEFRMEDFPCEPEADDLYQLTVRARDLAGNESLVSVRFSVNRFGSVYTLDEQTELLAGVRGSYYTNTEPDILVTETNADTLEFCEITCSLNGELYTLEEGTDYSVQRSGTDESWKQYTYRIPGRNFQKEGNYTLTIYTKDRARNVSDNHTKGKQIEFAVDKTAPSILLSGLEDGGRYREHSRSAVLDVQDNLMTAEVKVLINGIPSVYSASEVQEQDGRIILTAGSSGRWQSVRVTAYDAAGNRQELGERRFLITPNLFVQFFMNKRIFYGSMGGLLVLWAAVWHFFFSGHSRRHMK